MTDLYKNMIEAQDKWAELSDLGIAEAAAALDDLEKAEAAFFAVFYKKKAEWEAIPEGEKKTLAEENANDTEAAEGTRANKLFWYETAIAGYDLL